MPGEQNGTTSDKRWQVKLPIATIRNSGEWSDAMPRLRRSLRRHTTARRRIVMKAPRTAYAPAKPSRNQPLIAADIACSRLRTCLRRYVLKREDRGSHARDAVCCRNARQPTPMEQSLNYHCATIITFTPRQRRLPSSARTAWCVNRVMPRCRSR